MRGFNSLSHRSTTVAAREVSSLQAVKSATEKSARLFGKSDLTPEQDALLRSVIPIILASARLIRKRKELSRLQRGIDFEIRRMRALLAAEVGGLKKLPSDAVQLLKRAGL